MVLRYDVVGDGLVLSPLTLTSIEVLLPPLCFWVRESDGKIMARTAEKVFIVYNDGKVEPLNVEDLDEQWVEQWEEKVEKGGVSDEDVKVVTLFLERGSVLIPGLVDGHAHAPQTRNRGIGMDLPLLKWLERYTFPVRFYC